MSLPPPRIAIAVVAGLVATPLGVTPPGPAGGGDAPRAFLRAGMGLTADEIARLDRGEVVTRSLLAPEPEDVGGLAVVRVAVARGVFLERFRLIETFKRASAVLKVGDPATLLEPELGIDSNEVVMHVTALGIERDGFRNGWLGTTASMDNSTEGVEASESMAGVYVTRVPGWAR